MKTVEHIVELNSTELDSVIGGNAGDGAFVIGRGYVWVTAHFLTFGLSTLYLIAKNID